MKSFYLEQGVPDSGLHPFVLNAFPTYEHHFTTNSKVQVNDRCTKALNYKKYLTFYPGKNTPSLGGKHPLWIRGKYPPDFAGFPRFFLENIFDLCNC